MKTDPSTTQVVEEVITRQDWVEASPRPESGEAFAEERVRKRFPGASVTPRGGGIFDPRGPTWTFAFDVVPADPSTSPEKWPESAAERLAELDWHALTPDMKLTYVWDHGSERVDVERDNGGGSHYRGVFHPRDGMCTGNPCDYCGKAFVDELD